MAKPKIANINGEGRKRDPASPTARLYGRGLCSGDSTNIFLTDTSGGLSFYSLAAGAVADKSALPDLAEIFKYVSGMLGPHFAEVRLPTAHGKFLPPRAALDTHWGWVEKVLVASGSPPNHWPTIMGFVAHWVVKGANNGTVPAALAVKLVIETAIFMSKVDPRMVQGATAGQHPPTKWSNRALDKDGAREIVSEVRRLLPSAGALSALPLNTGAA